MRRVLILAAAALAISFVSTAEAQHPRRLNYFAPSNVPTPPIVRWSVGRAMAPRQNYWSQSLYGNGATFTQGYGPFGRFNQNTLYGNGFSYTSGYGIPSYGPGYGFAPYGGYGYGGGGFGGGY